MKRNPLFRLSILPFMLIVAFMFFSASNKKNGAVSGEEEWALARLSGLSLEEKIGQFFMVAAYSGQGEKHIDEVESMIEDQKIGGVIFFQGQRADLKEAITRFNKVSKTPLFFGMDAEWGVDMRLFGEERFPYAYTFGAAGDPELSGRIGAMMAQECREIGIHMNFSPVADVNSNPDNPVIGFRSFGENPKLVADQVKAFVKSFEESGVMSCIKHFPGHGNTDKDSHYELPTVSSSYKTLDAIDLFPFREGIRAGASSVMVGHLNVPALDDTGTPTSLSSRVIREHLIKGMGFNGLVISDALNMKAVADKYGKTDVVVKAFEAGCDILLFPESVKDAIDAIARKVSSGEISKKEIDDRCLKLLKAKYRFVVSPPEYKKFTEGEKQWSIRALFEKAITVVKNKEGLLPLKRLDKRIARISVGIHTFPFRESVDLFADVTHHHYFTMDEALREFPPKAGAYDVIILGMHSNTVRSRNNYGFGEKWNELVKALPDDKQVVLALFGNPYVLEGADVSNADAVVLSYENHSLAQDRMAQLIFGAMPAVGQLPVSVKGMFSRGDGLKIEWGGRLKFSQPEEFGIDPARLEEIDKIAENGIRKGAYPGCQIVVALKGSIIYRKSFGTRMYEDTSRVTDYDLYDIASVTKIAGSTVGLMRLQTKERFSLEGAVGDYLPEVKEAEYASINLREMMAHQAGLTAWIPFYKKTLKSGELDDKIYSGKRTATYSTQVARDLWIKSDYTDSIYRQITRTPLGAKSYVYSDLGYYFVKKIIEKQENRRIDEFLYNDLYRPMGLRSMCYEPLKLFKLSQIAPTERDMAFRKQLVHGYVHDPGAAMLGGIAGHAGLFSNATDLASLMQMVMNRGYYGGQQYVSASVVDEYTKAQFPGNRRGAGFDRPTASGGGTCHESASQKSFGHSGFTGTLAWADPESGINYVFLSNRVYPDQDNWRLRDMNIRTEIQRVIYEAVKSGR
jgi:beta-N-acetylhexosaminidase